MAIALTATGAYGVPLNINFLQVEVPAGSSVIDYHTVYQYAPVSFPGSSTYSPPGGVTYHALSGNGTLDGKSYDTYSPHAAIAYGWLAANEGAAKPVTDLWCLDDADFLNNYVQPWTGPYEYAPPPDCRRPQHQDR